MIEPNPPPDDPIADAFLARTVRLQRLASGLHAQVDNALEEMRKRIITELVGGSGRAGSVILIVSDVMRNVSANLIIAFRAALESQVEFARKTLRDETGQPVFFIETLELPEVLGVPFSSWFERIEQDMTLKSVSATRTLFATEPAPDVPSDFLSRELGLGLVAIDALIRTLLQAMANRVTREIVARSFEGYHWQQISVLDSRTSPICRDYAFKEWDADYMPVGGHALPFHDGTPRHWNCRSVVVPIFPKTLTTRLPLTLDGLMARIPVDVFGQRNSELFRLGLLTVADLVRQANRPLTVGDL